MKIGIFLTASVPRFCTLLAICVLLLLCLYSCGTEADRSIIPARLSIAELDTFSLPTSVRAIEVINDSTVWFAGSEGVYGYTNDWGRSWHIDSLRRDTLRPHFRSIAATGEAVFLLSIASPALLFRSVDQGRSWELVYEESHPAAFYDALAFWDEREGIAMGDPTDGCLSVLITRDGGRNWNKVPCKDLPSTSEGEAAFAASNSNIALFGDHVWIVSGGARARVFHSPDRGRHWSVSETPIVAGDQMTGIFSVNFADEQHGIIFGGDWNDKARNHSNKAITEDGGRSWQLVADGQHPGYRSCVQYAPAADGRILLAGGIPGLSYSIDGGQQWHPLAEIELYTLRFGSNWQNVWLAGNRKIGRLQLTEADR